LKLLVTGRGTSGSWAIRGHQLGHAIGADVIANALDVASYDIAVLVKRLQPDLVRRCSRAGVPFVWDVVDSWPQPVGNGWSRAESLAWLVDQVQANRPAAVVAATRAMAADLTSCGLPVLALAHHARPAQRLNLLREHVRVVGYEGGEQYLGRWRAVLERECSARGWRFIVNPEQLADLDIVVALRDSAGYAARQWKSNVKLANAQETGTPFIGNQEAGYLETAGGGERWADNKLELARALDELTPLHARRAASARLRSVAPKLEAVATTYRNWLESLCATAPRS